jgi:Spy/CpxP family protein refolding chaperone
MFNRHLLIVAGMALATGTAFAQGSYQAPPRYAEPQHYGDSQRDDRDSHSHATWREQQRTAEQDQRIRDGQANGSITPREASWLLDQQRQIRHVEWNASRDGVLTRDERHQIRYLQDRVDRSIDRMETNRHAY